MPYLQATREFKELIGKEMQHLLGCPTKLQLEVLFRYFCQHYQSLEASVTVPQGGTLALATSASYHGHSIEVCIWGQYHSDGCAMSIVLSNIILRA